MHKAVLISNDPRIINEFNQICAVTGMSWDVQTHVDKTKSDATYFIDASCSDINLDAANVHVVCIGQPTSQVWLLAGQVNAVAILTLPHDRSQLIELLTPTSLLSGRVIAVTQAVGGTGATTLASAIAHQLKNTGHECILLEVSSRYTGLDLALGDSIGEPIFSSQLINNPAFGVDGLNAAEGLRFIANNESHPIEQWITLINYVKSQSAFVVLDVASDVHNHELLKLCDDVVVSLTNTIRHTAVTRILLNMLSELDVPHGLAIRSVGGTSLNPIAIAEKLQTPLWASLPSDNRITEQIECGFGVSMIRLASFTRAISQLTIRLSDYYIHDNAA